MAGKSGLFGGKATVKVMVMMMMMMTVTVMMMLTVPARVNDDGGIWIRIQIQLCVWLQLQKGWPDTMRKRATTYMPFSNTIREPCIGVRVTINTIT